MDLESVAEELYGGSPDDFVERRKQRVADARAARDRALAKAIGQLRRPTRSAWMVNVLAREAPEAVAQLLDLGAALADAQHRAAGADLRRLSAERHSTLDALTRQAVLLAQSLGHAAAEASRLEVTQTLQAALADPGVAELVRTGRVTQPVSYAGFGPMTLAASPAAPSDPEPQEPQDPPPSETQPHPQQDAALVAAEEQVRRADDELQLAEQEAAEAEREAGAATEQADELAEEVEVLRTRLRQAETDEQTARSTARAARREAQQQAQAVSAARLALSDAQASLSELTAKAASR